MNTTIPIVLMFLSIILLLVSIFLLYYYGTTTYAMIIFIIGILFGIVACCLFVYLRTPERIEIL